MKKISSKASTILSIGFAIGLIAILFGTLFFVPKLVNFITAVHILFNGKINLFFVIPSNITGEILILVSTIIIYVLDTLGLITGVILLLLLLNVKKDYIFISENVSYLRVCSWLCIFAAVLFFALGSVFWTCLLLAFAAALVGLMLRVVKNIIERAVELKEENDLTI